MEDIGEELHALPDSMVLAIREASVCKRLVDPTACNQKSFMGYDFILRGEHLTDPAA